MAFIFTSYLQEEPEKAWLMEGIRDGKLLNILDNQKESVSSPY